jgi:sugar lactone lactonase YvrE
MKPRFQRVVFLTSGVLALYALPVVAQQFEIPPDTVTTVFVTDTVADFGGVGGVVVDALGYVYVADFRNAVWRIHPDGHVEKFADGLYGASGNAIGPRGYLYQSSFNGNYISKISRTGEVEMFADEGLVGPVGIAANVEGDLYVVNCRGAFVSKVDPDGTVSDFSRSDLFACPNGITFDDQGDLFVVNFNNTKIIRITPDGVASEFADVPGAGGNGHITFARGAFYVTKLRGNQVFRLNRDGTSSVVAGTGQPGEGDGPALQATMTSPNGIGVSANGKELWVNDFTVRPGAGQGVVTMRRIKLVTISDVLSKVDPADGVDAVRAVFRAYHEARPSEDTSVEVGTLGFAWLSSADWQLGVALFEMASERFPNNVVAQFNCGEAYRYTSQPGKAATQYRRVLELQPDHVAAAARLAEVGGGEAG